MKIFNSLSIQMVATGSEFSWHGRKVSVEEASKLVQEEGIESYIGHEDTARVLSGLLQVECPFRRAFGTISSGEKVLVAQLSGGRLPEGVTTLPTGFEIQFWVVSAE